MSAKAIRQARLSLMPKTPDAPMVRYERIDGALATACF
jgi:hypothetical protein